MYVENITAVKGEEEVIFPSGSEFLVEMVTNEKQFVYNDNGTNIKKVLTEIKIIIPLNIAT